MKKKKLVKDENGVAMAEYALLTSMLIAAIQGVFFTFNSFLHQYFKVVTSVIALPIP